MEYEIACDLNKTRIRDSDRAWAAIKNQKVVAIRYMNDFEFDVATSHLEGWVHALESQLRYRSLESFSPLELSKLKQIAVDAGHPGVGPKGGYFPALKILKKARDLLEAAQRDAFSNYRQECRQALAEFGEVLSGTVVGTVFIPKE